MNTKGDASTTFPRSDAAANPAGASRWQSLRPVRRVAELGRHHTHTMNVPEQFLRYACSDYFAEGWADRGHFDEASQTLVIAPLAEAYEDKSAGFFAIGRSGCDGVDFGYRLGQTGLWAYYPIEQDFKLMAPTVAELAEGWCSGTLTV